MTINCVWEHNGNDTLLYAVDYVGAYTRGESLDIAKAKMPAEILSYLKWCGENASNDFEIVITGEKVSDLNIKDADSDVLFESEKTPLTAEEYEKIKALALKSAKDFLSLYELSIKIAFSGCIKSHLFCSKEIVTILSKRDSEIECSFRLS